MSPRVEVAEGTAFEVLLAAAAIADPDWRQVFTTGPTVYADALAAGGPDFVRWVADLGRFGWINLIGLLTRVPLPWELDRLITAVRETSPADLHYLTVGGDRRQLVQAIDEARIRQALAGPPSARGELATVLAADDHVLDGTTWLLDASSNDVHGRVVDLLQGWQRLLLPEADEVTLGELLHRHAATARSRLAETTGRGYLDDTIGGLHYAPAGLDRVLVIVSPSVAPVVVVVDGRSETVILHPPNAHGSPVADGPARLLELSRAIGDRTRMRLLTRLRTGETTAVDLALALGAPRTTLLHHLAILRAAGLIHVTVTPGNATVYRLRPEGFDELAAAAADFIPTQ